MRLVLLRVDDLELDADTDDKDIVDVLNVVSPDSVKFPDDKERTSQLGNNLPTEKRRCTKHLHFPK